MPRLVKGNGVVPIPDPTKLTVDAVNSLKNDILAIIDLRFAGSNDLIEEKFDKIATASAMRDAAVAAAFRAEETITKQQNESNMLAIDKASIAFTKQLDSLDEKISDLKERMTILESKSLGIVTANTAHRESTIDNRGMIFALSGIGIALVTLIIGYFRSLQHIAN